MSTPLVGRRTLPLFAVLTLALLFAAALEAWFGRPELFGDDISYLDLTHMIQQGNWRHALNPLWSLGYPLLLTVVRPVFPTGVSGELAAVFTLNLAIFLAGWLALVYFLQTACQSPGAPSQSVPSLEVGPTSTAMPPSILLAAAAVFLCAQTNMGRVSSIGPDSLVAAIFFLASALLLRFAQQPTPARGIQLGTLLGLGFIAKAVFLPLSIIFIAIALLPLRRKLPAPIATAIPAAFLVFLLPYAAAISWALGRPTLGEAAALNYAFHVNQLPHWMGWQGGPAPFRTPLHPVHLLRQHPAVFAFGEPFHVTYPPQFNLHFWYDGYKHFFSPINALRAILTNLHELEKVLHENWPLTLAVLLIAAVACFHRRPPLSRRFAWQAFLPSLLGIVLYIQVHLEARYVAPFLTILAILPLLLLEQTPPRKPWLHHALLAILLLGAAADLTFALAPSARRANHREDMQSSPQWRIAQYLQRTGLKPGDRVAAVTLGNDIRCTWAYAAGLHIVADIGNDAYNPTGQSADFTLFWTDPATQSDVLRLFRQQGALAVIVPQADLTQPPLNPSWQPIPNSTANGYQAYILDLR